ncbi:uncharacterized protein JN550_004806 [Neoarthrinium moseri]|uniref:uncharacterized protein n=1 Tax=Neoarthrinium moseri TaxID=1658444 RepID=UPI001FDD6D6E|nr:uncharacterized protein JN550_004806 [Neoarthrinium moseri]KAI1871361.1 hypothetical protein JN550_004806 [Neoarthrinium moseri]
MAGGGTGPGVVIGGGAPASQRAIGVARCTCPHKQLQTWPPWPLAARRLAGVQPRPRQPTLALTAILRAQSHPLPRPCPLDILDLARDLHQIPPSLPHPPPQQHPWGFSPFWIERAVSIPVHYNTNHVPPTERVDSFDFLPTMSLGYGADALLDLTTFDQRNRYPYTTTAAPTAANPAAFSHPAAVAAAAAAAAAMAPPTMPPGAWPMGPDMAAGPPAQGSSTMVSSPNDSQHSHTHSQSQSQSSSPTQQSASPLQQSPTFQGVGHVHSPALLTDWTLLQHQQQHPATHDISQFIQESTLIPFNPFHANFPTNAIGYLPATTQPPMDHMSVPGFNGMSSMEDPQALSQPWEGMGMANWQDFGASLQFPADGLPRFGSLGSQSPTGTYLEVLSLGSSSDNDWSQVNMYQNYDQYQQIQAQAQAQVQAQAQAHAQAQSAAIFNPSQTLHLRTNSDASHSDGSQPLEMSSSYEEVAPFNYSPFSPGSDTYSDSHRNCFHSETHHNHDIVSPSAAVAPMAIKSTASSPSSSRSSGSGVVSPSAQPTVRRGSGPRKSPIAKSTTKSVTRRISNGKKDGTVEKKVGRRKGPLLPEQRKQASEIRKLRACLRCKFLKKTCDTGEPCNGCQPSHARLWQVPCTRIDIKDIGYFMKDWKADYERHLMRGVSVYNVKGFSPKESVMWITHGYGFCLPVMVREVYVADESCFSLDWVESYQADQEPIEFDIRTEKLDVGEKGVNIEALADYLDKHIDGAFETFIDDHFEGTPFITQIFKTAHRFYVKEKTPVIRKALKLVLAYNLTLHITMVELQGSEQLMEGQIDDEDSKYYGKYVAPVLINFQIKCAMADMWRELQKDILEELSALYSSVYSGDRLKNWPTIFMLACILLAVWEEMQFDCHYRVPDPIAVEKFCNDMESTPVGVITGLFHAISQKLPALTDWDTQRHGQLLNNNVAVCEAMTEVRQHVLDHETYLRSRNNTKFDRYDFDSLSNKFLSKLVIKAN